jgi:hypothetical protein
MHGSCIKNVNKIDKGNWNITTKDLNYPNYVQINSGKIIFNYELQVVNHALNHTTELINQATLIKKVKSKTIGEKKK